jgi:hypothetical protein
MAEANRATTTANPSQLARKDRAQASKSNVDPLSASETFVQEAKIVSKSLGNCTKKVQVDLAHPDLAAPGHYLPSRYIVKNFRWLLRAIFEFRFPWRVRLEKVLFSALNFWSKIKAEIDKLPSISNKV